jgi:hypothetical protein
MKQFKIVYFSLPLNPRFNFNLDNNIRTYKNASVRSWIFFGFYLPFIDCYSNLNV